MSHTFQTKTIKTVIHAGKSRRFLDVNELWHYRELLLMLVWRDIAVRYKQSVVGIGWAVIQPIMTMIIFSIIFGKLAKLPSDGIPYPIFAYCALLPWNYFARALTDSSDSLTASTHLITKVYFPRIVLPLSKVIAALVDFMIAFGILIIMILWYRIVPTANLIFLPVFMLLGMMTALGVGLWLTALNVKYRDVKFVTPFLVQLWMYASPVAYSTSLIPEQWRWLYYLNPMTGVIEGFRWALLAKTAPDFKLMITSVVVIGFIFVWGMRYFVAVEDSFTDII